MKNVCLECGHKYEATKVKGIDKRQKFCLPRCREKNWRKNNVNRNKELHKKWRDKREIRCRYCGKNIPLSKRKHGVVFCSDPCRKNQGRANRAKFTRKVSDLFLKYKESIGCKVCGYNKCGASLDFHHSNPSRKKRRITSKMWYSNTKTIRDEIKKCVLMCKNCHAEKELEIKRK